MIATILTIAHLLLDFTFQSNKIAELKKINFNYMMLHSFVYLIGYAIVAAVFLSPIYAVYVTVILSVSHFIIDLIRSKIDLKLGHTLRFISFILDQVLHISIIISSVPLLRLNSHTNGLYAFILNYKDSYRIMLCILLFVVIWDVASVFIKKVFEVVLSSDALPNEQNNDLRMGNLIGKLERIVVTILILLNQYSVIGLVLTAKSIARFKQLEDKAFAEKYLVGTLTSISFALVATIIIKNFL